MEEGVKEVKLRLVTELQPAEEEEGNAEGKSGGAETKNKKKKEEEEKEVLIPDWFWRRVRRGKVCLRGREEERGEGKDTCIKSIPSHVLR